MLKKLLIVIASVFLMTACSPKGRPVPESFQGPTSGPDIDNIKPTVGPN